MPKESLGSLLAQTFSAPEQPWLESYFLQSQPHALVANTSLSRDRVAQLLDTYMCQGNDDELLNVARHHLLSPLQYRKVADHFVKSGSLREILALQPPPSPNDLRELLDCDTSGKTASWVCHYTHYVGLYQLAHHEQLKIVERASSPRKFAWLNGFEDLSAEILETAKQWLNEYDASHTCFAEMCAFVCANAKTLRQNGLRRVVRYHKKHGAKVDLDTWLDCRQQGQNRPPYTTQAWREERLKNLRHIVSRSWDTTTTTSYRDYLAMRLNHKVPEIIPPADDEGSSRWHAEYFMRRLGENKTNWDTFLALSEAWDGTIEELVATTKALA